MASLFVIQGADQGKRFEFTSSPVALGRDNSNAVQLHDNEVSRRHAELRLVAERVSRSSTWARPTARIVNDQPVEQTVAALTGDRVQLGQTVMLFHDGAPRPQRDLTARVDLLAGAARTTARPSSGASRRARARGSSRRPDAAAGWLARAADATSRSCTAPPRRSATSWTSTRCSPQILELVFESIGADRGAILLKDESGQLVPKAVRWREPGRARRADDDLADDRRPRPGARARASSPPTPPATSGSARRSRSSTYQIREAICVPIQGRHTTLGVLYADIQAGAGFARDRPAARAPRATGSPRTSSC